MRHNHQYESDSKLPEANHTVKVPFLYIGTDQDAVCPPEILEVRGICLI